MSQRSNSQLESVSRVIKLLDCFLHDQHELRLTDLSDATGMSKTQVLRIASSLEAGDYLRRDPNHKRYRLGLRILQLGAVARDNLDIRRLGHPILERLVAATLETARLVIVDDHGPLCADLLQSPHGIRLHARLGERMPWHAGASGPVILAHLPKEQQEELLYSGPLTRFNAATETNPDVIFEELAVIRNRGYAANSASGLIEGAMGVAAPVFGEDREVVAAIGLGAPASRWTPENVERYIELVKEASAQLSRELGYRTHNAGDRVHRTSDYSDCML